MKWFYLWLAALFLSLPASAQLLDDFSDGDFTASPVWQGDAAHFTVNAARQLQSNGPNATSVIYLSTPNTQCSGTEWQFSVSLNFAPSNASHVRIYLISDQANLKGNLNGYYIRVGEDGTADGVDLFRQSGSTHTKIIDGIAGRAAINPNLGIKVIRDAAGNWQLFSDNSGGTSFAPEGSVADATFTSTAFSGVSCTFTATRRQGFFFDNLVVRDAPISLIGASPEGPEQVRVFFSTQPEPNSATRIISYSFDNGAAVRSVAVDPADPSQVLLTLNVPLPDGDYTLSVSGVQDRNGSAVPAGSLATFSYAMPISPRDIVINELMADESPRVDLPPAEFVELFNPSGRTINLKGCSLSDPGTSVFLPEFFLPAGGYLILCREAALAEFRPYGPAIGLSSWPSLNNSGDLISLRSPSGILIDQVNYTDKWYGDTRKAEGGWTLEQINPFTACPNFTNWKASEDPAGGTPGQVNSVFSNAPDRAPPQVTEAKATDSQTIEIYFSEPMDSVLLKRGTYQIAGINIREIQPVSPGYTSVRLLPGTALTAGTLYMLTLDGLADCAGNGLVSITLKVGTGAEPQYHGLILTEIMADEDPPVGLPKAEYLELYNPTGKVISLKGLTFTDAASTANFPDEVIFPGEYTLLCASPSVPLLKPFGRTISLTGFSLNNTGEPLTLRNATGGVICSTEYRTGWYGDSRKADGGWALEMIDPQNPCGEAGNWTASADPAGGTPGKLNSVNASRPDLTPPQSIAVEVIHAFSLLVLFPEKVDSLGMAQPDAYAIDKGMEVAKATPVSPQFRAVQLTLTTSLVAGTLYTLTVSNARDCAGNMGGNALHTTFALPEPGDSGDVVLNEVLFNPRSGGVDFVEIYNRSAKYVSLKDWQLANIKDGQPDSGKKISEGNLVLPPRQYMVFTTSRQALKDHYPRAEDSTFIILSSLPSYPDDAGSVVLLNHGNQVIDLFDYDEKFHFALIDRRDGVSLERISVHSPGNTRHNWHSAASTEGYATPGYRNSQGMDAEKAGTKTFRLMPGVFTPDEDGYNDFTTLQYQLPGRGNVATVSVYDGAGREVKKWIRNELLGTEGFYTWDGTDDRGEKVRTGRYIVFITLFDLQGRQQQYKEEVVVGAKF